MSCAHPGTRVEIRKFPRMGQPAGFRFQCLECLDPIGKWLDRRHLPGGLHPGHVLMAKIDVKGKRGATGLGGEGNSKRRAYAKFIRSAAWKKQRERVLARDNDTCRDCGGHATEGAHIRYGDPIERTPDSWIKASCRACNAGERSQRITRGVLGACAKELPRQINPWGHVRPAAMTIDVRRRWRTTCESGSR